MLDDGSASLDSIGCVAPAAEVELEDVDSDPAASAVADAPSDDEVSGPAAASPSDVGLSAAVALGAESVAFESPESQGPGLKLKFTGLSKKNPAKFGDACSVRVDGLSIGCLGQWAERGRENSNMHEFFCKTLYM